ncbi:MAG: hypothetical protein M3Z30_10855 [Gemmatimonadota bacterium]|nr:hypothetical protein [Gemmatimonadota bacterium]
MNTRSFASALTATLIVAAAVACSDSTAPAGSSAASASAQFEVAVTPDLAPSAGEDVSTDYAFMSGADMTGSGASFSISAPGATIVGVAPSAIVNTPPSGGAATWISPSCVFNAGTGRFNCPPVKKGAQTYTVSYALMDIKGTTQSAYNKSTTASINFIVADTGATSFSSNGNSFSDTTYRLHNRTVSNLLGDTVHVWNGTGSGSVHSTRSGQILKIYSFVSVDTATGVAFKQPRDINPYPLRGTMAKDYTVVRTREASDTTTHTTTRHVLVTFNGTANVPMVINGANYTLNLDTHKVTKQ